MKDILQFSIPVLTEEGRQKLEKFFSETVKPEMTEWDLSKALVHLENDFFTSNKELVAARYIRCGVNELDSAAREHPTCYQTKVYTSSTMGNNDTSFGCMVFPMLYVSFEPMNEKPSD